MNSKFDGKHAYVAKLECGCICCAQILTPDNVKESKREVATWLKYDDVEISIVTIEEAKSTNWHGPDDVCEEFLYPKTAKETVKQ